MSDTVHFEHRGIKCRVGPRTPFPGIGWSVQMYCLGQHLWRDSDGAFYDDHEDHPEGAYAWAEASCREFIDQALGTED